MKALAEEVCVIIFKMSVVHSKTNFVLDFI